MVPCTCTSPNSLHMGSDHISPMFLYHPNEAKSCSDANGTMFSVLGNGTCSQLCNTCFHGGEGKLRSDSQPPRKSIVYRHWGYLGQGKMRVLICYTCRFSCFCVSHFQILQKHWIYILFFNFKLTCTPAGILKKCSFCFCLKIKLLPKL